MATIIDALKSKMNLLAGEGVSETMITEAEKTLNLSFSSEYKEYLKTYGIAAYGGHELTGITRSSHVNVVDVTKDERERNPDVPADLYVIEETDVEEIVIWQSGDGKIFYSGPNQKLTHLCNSLSEYVSK